MRILIVSGADEAYVSLLDELISSIRRWEELLAIDIACLDVGLSPGSRAALAPRVSRIVEPRWDLPVDAALRAASPGLRALTARPFLPRYFPDYEIYVWLDADTWVQFPFAVDWLVGAAKEGMLGAVPHTHAAYETTPESLRWRTERMHAYFGPADSDRIRWDVYLNSGVFALPADAPHWAAWARSFARGLEATEGRLCTDQTALNHAVWTGNLPLQPLPAVCNWLAHLALPGFDSAGKGFCEPIPPGHYIGIMHLTGKASRTRRYDLRQAGPVGTMSLRYPGGRR
jgi:lipopolysaccharide biosynthesis glycosyltransferase